MPSVISCSRRTDIPAYYAPWLINRLRAGYCHTMNPFGGQVYRIPLAPPDVIALAFWTRNPAPMSKYLDELEARGYSFYFNMTVTGYSTPFEPHNLPLPAALRTFQEFARRLSASQMRWRYDPIVISSATPADYHLRHFEEIARELAGCTHHCTFSFVQFYGKTTRNMGEIARKAGVSLVQPALEEQQALARQLAEIARGYGMSFNSCCNDALLVEGVTRNRCIDPALIQQLAPGRAEGLKSKPTRPGCGCVASVDIGAYDTCLFDCAYCYATSHPTAARKRHADHNPEDSLLWRPEQLRGQDLNSISVPLKSS
jgi:hypothetical protein